MTLLLDGEERFAVIHRAAGLLGAGCRDRPVADSTLATGAMPLGARWGAEGGRRKVESEWRVGRLIRRGATGTLASYDATIAKECGQIDFPHSAKRGFAVSAVAGRNLGPRLTDTSRFVNPEL
jgi:hypothetical protein